MFFLFLVPCTCCVCIRCYRVGGRRWRFLRDLQRREKEHNSDPENPTQNTENVGTPTEPEHERQLPVASGLSETAAQKLNNKTKAEISKAHSKGEEQKRSVDIKNPVYDSKDCNIPKENINLEEMDQEVVYCDDSCMGGACNCRDQYIDQVEAALGLRIRGTERENYIIPQDMRSEFPNIKRHPQLRMRKKKDK